MLRASQVNPGNFQVDQILYEGAEFSLVWGTYYHKGADQGDRRVGLRWNGDPDDDTDQGYPVTRKPMWFVVPPVLAPAILRQVIASPGANVTEMLETLRRVDT